MKPKISRLSTIVLSLALLGLAACNVPTGPVTTGTVPTGTVTTGTVPTTPQASPATSAPGPALTATQPPAGPTVVVPTVVVPATTVPATAVPATDAPTAEPAATSLPTQAPVQGGSAPVIAADNLARLSQMSFYVPEWPERMLWPAPEAPLPPGWAPPFPDLLLQAGPNLHPLLLDPPGLGMPLAIPLNGTQPLAFAPDATSVVIKDPSRTALFRLDGPIVRELQYPSSVYGASYSPDGRFLVLTSGERFEAAVYDLGAPPDSGPVATLTGFETAAPVYDVTIAPGGRTIAWHARASFQLQDVASGKLDARIDYSEFIGNMRFSPDGSKLAVEVAGQLYLYRLPATSQIAALPLAAPLSALGWSPDGTLLAGGDATGLQLWDGNTLEPRLALPAPGLAQLSFAPSGRYIATVQQDNAFAVWSVK